MVNSSPENPKISVIVRTIGRPFVLSETLISLRNQTYKNFEVVIIEDGPEISKFHISSQFPDLNIRYFCTDFHTGRAKAGNIGLRTAKGEYFIFLDDDDEFFPDHLEVLIERLEKDKGRAAYSLACEVQTDIISTNPYVYTEKGRRVVFNQPFNLLLLLWRNYIPIQAILFHRSLYDECGGFDESLDYLEDWDLWIRYSATEKFIFIPNITSKYRVPPERSDASREREKKFREATHAIREKQKQTDIIVNMGRVVDEVEVIYHAERQQSLNDIRSRGFFFGLECLSSMVKQYFGRDQDRHGK
jgi:glycosyltransferase involved in cell wall biosynthesis